MFLHYILVVDLIICTVVGKHVGAMETTSIQDTIRTRQNNVNDPDFLSKAIAPSWVASPNTRGTGDILFTCLLTIAACIYTAIHPRIPYWDARSSSNSLRRKFWDKYGVFEEKMNMCLEALFCPEIVLTAAIRERRLAKALQKDLKMILETQKDYKTNLNEDMITTEFCYFGVMGGFLVSIRDIRPSESAHFRSSFNGALPEDLTLSPDGIRLVVELGHLDLLLQHAAGVDDKNKANTFQKLLVVVQLSWMVLQCIVRKFQKLPISLLEIHTFVHAAFAVLLYIAWFSKPADISRAVRVPTDDFEDALALMVQEQFCEAQNIMTCLYPQQTPENKRSMAAVRANRKTMPPIDKPGFPTFDYFASDGKQKKVNWIETTGDKFTEIYGRWDEIDGNALPCGVSYSTMFSLPVKYTGFLSGQRAYAVRCMTFARRRIFFSPEDKVRAARVIKHINYLDQSTIQFPQPYVNCKIVVPNQKRCRYPNHLYRTAFYFDPKKWTWTPPGQTYEFNRHARNSDFVLDNNRAVPVTKRMVLNTAQYWVASAPDPLTHFDRFCIIFFGALNGGIHLAAWNSVFPTPIEGLCWNISSLIIATLIPMWNVHYLLELIIKKCIGPLEMRMKAEGGGLVIEARTKWFIIRTVEKVAGLLYWSMQVAFFAARAYLLVESFISLRHMPYGVYVMPSWLEVFPHL